MILYSTMVLENNRYCVEIDKRINMQGQTYSNRLLYFFLSPCMYRKTRGILCWSVSVKRERIY